MSISCLIVEDAPFMREIYMYALASRPQIEVVGEAVDGKEAIELLASLKPDLVLLDLVLPIKNGFEVLKEMARVSPQTKAIVITSLEEESMFQKARLLGVNHYIKKPFTKKELLNTFDQITEDYSEVQNG